MARQLRINYPGAFYHVTSLGNEQKAVFKSKRDREKFLEYLETATLRYDAVVHVYCQMDNHYHLLLETPKYTKKLTILLANLNFQDSIPDPYLLKALADFCGCFYIFHYPAWILQLLLIKMIQKAD